MMRTIPYTHGIVTQNDMLLAYSDFFVIVDFSENFLSDKIIPVSDDLTIMVAQCQIFHTIQLAFLTETRM